MKAILVVDVPNEYSKKDIYVLHEIYTYEGNRYERIEEYKEGVIKAKPLPKKKHSLSIDDTIIKDKFRGETIHFEKAIELAIEKGWNWCLDEILGEVDDE